MRSSVVMMHQCAPLASISITFFNTYIRLMRRRYKIGSRVKYKVMMMMIISVVMLIWLTDSQTIFFTIWFEWCVGEFTTRLLVSHENLNKAEEIFCYVHEDVWLLFSQQSCSAVESHVILRQNLSNNFAAHHRSLALLNKKPRLMLLKRKCELQHFSFFF